MTLPEARQVLAEAQQHAGEWQQEHLAEITAAMRVFWSQHPSEDDFAATMGHIVLSARSLYILLGQRMVSVSDPAST